MENSINTSPISEKLEDLINSANLDIFDEEIWKGKDIWKISEVTYSYVYENKDSVEKINTTLFVSGGGLDLKEYYKSDYEGRKYLLISSKKRLEKILKDKKESIQLSLEEVDMVDFLNHGTVETDIKEIFINSLKEKNQFIDYCLNGLDFELEKAGIKSNATEEKQLETQIIQSEIDKDLFGGNIKDNIEETRLSYEYIYEKYQKNKHKLSSLEIERLEKYLEKALDILPDDYEYIEKEKPKEIVGDFLNVEIPRNDYIFSFNALIEALTKLEHIAESNEEVKSISDGPQKVQFPLGEKYNYMNILRFFKLGNHEFETHSITDYNGNQLIGNMRGKNSTEKDEGVAMLMEQLFMYGENLYKTVKDKNGNDVEIIDIDKIQINSYFTKTLMGELLNNDELLDYLEIVEKIDPDVSGARDRFDRLKRNNLLAYFVQHKDTTYTRGLFKAIDEINKYKLSNGEEGTSPEDLFLGKISFEETGKLKNIKKSKEKKGEDIEIIKPLFISDAVYFIINEKLEGRIGNIISKKGDVNSKKFYQYLNKKYSIFNLSQEEIDKISYETKRNVYGIVNVMLKNIGRHNIERIQSRNNVFNTQIIDQIKRPALKILDNHYDMKIKKVKNNMHHSRKHAA